MPAPFSIRDTLLSASRAYTLSKRLAPFIPPVEFRPSSSTVEHAAQRALDDQVPPRILELHFSELPVRWLQDKNVEIYPGVIMPVAARIFYGSDPIWLPVGTYFRPHVCSAFNYLRIDWSSNHASV